MNKSENRFLNKLSNYTCFSAIQSYSVSNIEKNGIKYKGVNGIFFSGECRSVPFYGSNRVLAHVVNERNNKYI